jgi:hypothetical protein
VNSYDSNEPSGFMKCWEFRDNLIDFYAVKKDSVPRELNTQQMNRVNRMAKAPACTPLRNSREISEYFHLT